jgi:hypothetical protein
LFNIGPKKAPRIIEAVIGASAQIDDHGFIVQDFTNNSGRVDPDGGV